MAIYKDIRLRFFIIQRSKSGSFMSRLVIISIFVGITWSLIACNAALTNKSTCVSCHINLEPASKSHPSCVECHGGDNQAEDKDVSHRLMYGPKNPSDPNFGNRPAESVIPINYNGSGPISCTPIPA